MTEIFYDGKRVAEYSDDPQLQPGGEYKQKPDSYWVGIAKKLFEEGDKINGIPQQSSTFRSTHFSEPNILAHVRFNERTDANGSKTLFIEEIQSDWHQKGRDRGYVLEVDPKTLPVKPDAAGRPGVWEVTMPGGEKVEYATRSPERAQELAATKLKSQGVPDAPFKKSWPELAMKRMIRWAAENGFDKVAWTTGTQQVARYPEALRQVVDDIKWGKEGYAQENYVQAEKAGSKVIRAKFNREGIVTHSTEGKAEGKHLSELFGKTMAQRMVDEPFGQIKGEDFTVGGEGMKGFYDKMLVDVGNKLGKRFGAKVGETTLKWDAPTMKQMERQPGVEKIKPDFGKVHSLEITPSMKSSVLREGQPLFQEDKPPSWEEQPNLFRPTPKLSEQQRAEMIRKATEEKGAPLTEAEQGNLFRKTPHLTEAEKKAALKSAIEAAKADRNKRASITFTKTAEGLKAAIKALNNPNVTSLPHEEFHLFLHDLYRTFEETGDLQTAKDIATTEKWVGVKKPGIENWTRANHEKFANGGLEWLRTSEAPNSSIARVFMALQKWLVEFYKTHVAELPELSAEMRAVFDRLVDVSPEKEFADALGMEPSPKTPVDQKLFKLVTDARKKTEEAVAETKGAAKTGIAGIIDGGKRLVSEMTHIKKFTAMRKSINKWSADVQISLHEIEAMENHMIRLVPNKLDREAISVYREAGGNQKLIWSWIDQMEKAKVPAKHIKPFEAATELQAPARKIAAALDRFYARKLEEGQKISLINEGKKNYATHIWESRGEKVAGLFGGGLKKRFAFAERSSYQNFFDGLMHGDTPKTMDAAELAGIYAGEFSKVKLTREFVKTGAQTPMADGRPMIAPQGRASTIIVGEEGSQARIELKPGQDTSDYRTFDHPAFRDWNVQAITTAGEPVTVRGNLSIHPEALRWVKAAVGKSKIREWYEKPDTAVMTIAKTAVKWVDIAQGVAKQSMFSLSGFHFTSIGLSGASMLINPFPTKFKLNPSDPLQRFLIERSLKVISSEREISKFSEGLSSGNVIHRIPGVGPLAKVITDHLFKVYIPTLKMKTALEMFRRNMKHYKKELDRGEVTVDDVGYLSARQANYSYGELNYADMGRDPTVQHFLRAAIVAPDYIEAKFGYMGQALRGGGREPLKALALVAAVQYVGLRILNKLMDDDYHWAEPFSLVVGNRKYNVRTDPFDIAQGFKDFNMFMAGRLSPILGEFSRWLVTKRDWRGQKVAFSEELLQLLHNAVPISLRNDQEVNAWEQFLNGMGAHVGRYSPNWQMKKRAISWMQANGHGINEATFPTSQYARLRGAIEDNDLDRVHREYIALVKKKGLKVDDNFKAHLFHPFTNSKDMDDKFYNSLDDSDKKLFNLAVRRRRETWKRLQTYINSMDEKQKADRAAAVEEFKSLRKKQVAGTE